MTAKKAPPDERAATKRGAAKTFAEAGTERRFAHPDGRTYSLEVDGCRAYEGWTLASGKGQANRSTRDDEASAHAFAWRKVAELAKKGYVEGEPRARRRYDPDADVVEVLWSDVDYAGARRSDFQPMAGRAHAYAHANVSVAQWLVTSDDRRLGILLRASVWKSQMAEEERAALAGEILDVLGARREEILEDRATPLRKIALARPIGRFTHLVVLSPEVASVSVSRDVNIENTAIARSVFRAFPAFECEAVGDETVTVAEARTSGRGCIPSARWDRDPHPVLDLAYVKKANETLRFLVFDPKELERRFSATALAKMAGVALHARNHAGEVRVWERGAAAPEMAELRAFFGYAG